MLSIGDAERQSLTFSVAKDRASHLRMATPVCTWENQRCDRPLVPPLPKPLNKIDCGGGSYRLPAACTQSALAAVNRRTEIGCEIDHFPN